MGNGHWRSQNGCYFEFSCPRDTAQSRQRNGPNHDHLLRNRIAPSVTLPNPALNLSESPPAHASLHRADALGAIAEVRPSPLNRPDYPAAGNLMPRRATRSKKPIPRSLINSDQHPERRCSMRDYDFVSDGFLALVAAGLLLLCSSLLVVAFS
jgi:hypothetical protein